LGLSIACFKAPKLVAFLILKINIAVIYREPSPEMTINCEIKTKVGSFGYGKIGDV
jgi:hypothetical protein